MQLKLILFTVVLSLIIGALAIYTSFLPKTVVTNKTIAVDVSVAELDDFFNSPINWINWLVGDSTLVEAKSIANNTKGLPWVAKWWSKELGDGALEFLYVGANSIHYQLISDNNLFRELGSFSWGQDGEVSLINWSDTLDISTNLSARWMNQDILRDKISQGKDKIAIQLTKQLLYLNNNNSL